MTEECLPSPSTEERNPLSVEFDLLDGREQVILFLADQQKAFAAHEFSVDALEQCVDLTTEQRKRGGRLVYVGAGTSGRLGVLDAVECKPTFSASPGEVIGVIAGGEKAMMESVGAAEEDPELGASDLKALDIGPHDMVIGITASGTTPYVHGALRHAHACSARTALICCATPPEDTSTYVDCILDLDTGPEIVTGSTSTKAGTSTKVALNAISTLSSVRLGKTFGNLMVDVHPHNAKLRQRANRIVREAGDVSEERAAELLAQADGACKPATVMALLNVSVDEARALLAEHEGHVRRAFEARAEGAGL